jgi:murein DD-endopeptidase MepM/ murein hydrolase activator NlpD
MNTFKLIADLFNAIFAALDAFTRYVGDRGPRINTIPPTQNPPDNDNEKPIGPKNRALITRPERISARFMDTGSPAWRNQWPGTPMAGRHGGTDFAAPPGSPVYAPLDMRIVKIGFYGDSGRYGYYVIGTLGDGLEYYSGHLQNVKVKEGDYVQSGDQIGQTNALAHTHIQLKRNGQIIDPEGYLH